MSEDRARVILATFHNYRTVLGRKCLQLIFEIPIEQQSEALNLLGYPNAAEPSWYAIARLKEKPEVGPTDRPLEGPTGHAKLANESGNRETAGTSKPKRRFNELSLPQQCGIRCDDGRFERYLRDQHPLREEATPRDFVCEYCEIQSRSELSTNHEAANRWRKLESEFQRWLTDQEYAESVR